MAQLAKYVRDINMHGALRAGTELLVKKKITKGRHKRTLQVAVRRHKVPGRGRWQCITPSTRLDCAFDKDGI